MEVLKNSIEINPLPILSGIKSQKSEKEDYIPQIHPDEQSNYMIYKMNETFTNEEKKKENLNDSYLKTEEKLSNNNVLPYPSDKDNSKKAIKLISVPHEKELLKNQENPQEYQESNLQKVDNEKILEIFDPKDSQILSPNLNELVRKKSILKGSPRMIPDMKRLDAKGNLISEKKHNISFRADLYEINEVESYKNAMKEQKFWEKCCKLCSIQ